MIRVILACWGLSSLLGPLPVQIGYTEHFMTIRKQFAGGVIETFGMLILNISDRSYRKKQCTDEQKLPRSLPLWSTGLQAAPDKVLIFFLITP